MHEVRSTIDERDEGRWWLCNHEFGSLGFPITYGSRVFDASLREQYNRKRGIGRNLAEFMSDISQCCLHARHNIYIELTLSRRLRRGQKAE